MAVNPFMRAKEVTPQQTYVDQYVPLPFDQFQRNIAAKDKLHDDLTSEFATAVGEGKGYAGVEDAMYKQWARSAEDKITNYVTEHPDLANNPTQARQLISSIAKEQKFGTPAMLNRRAAEYERHKKLQSELGSEWSQAKRQKADAYIELNKAGVGRDEQGNLKELYDPGSIRKSINASERIQSYGKDIKDTYIPDDYFQKVGGYPILKFVERKGVSKPRAHAVVLKRAMDDEELRDDAVADIQSRMVNETGDMNNWFYEPSEAEILNELSDNISATEMAVTRMQQDTQLRTLDEMGAGAASKRFAPAGYSTETNLFNIQGDPSMTSFEEMNQTAINARNLLKAYEVNKAAYTPLQVEQARADLANVDRTKDFVKKKLEKDGKFNAMFNKFLLEDIPTAISSNDPNFIVAKKKLNQEGLKQELMDKLVEGVEDGTIKKDPKTNKLHFSEEIKKKMNSSATRYYSSVVGASYNPREVSESIGSEWVDDMADIASEYLEELDSKASVVAHRYDMDRDNTLVKKNDPSYAFVKSVFGDDSFSIKSKLTTGNFAAFSPTTGEVLEEDQLLKTIANDGNAFIEKVDPIEVGGKPGFELTYKPDADSEEIQKLFITPKGGNKKLVTDQMKQSLIKTYNTNITEMVPEQARANKDFIYSYGNPNLEKYNSLTSGGPTKQLVIETLGMQGDSFDQPIDYNYGRPVGKKVKVNVAKDGDKYYIMENNTPVPLKDVNDNDFYITDPITLDRTIQRYIRQRN